MDTWYKGKVLRGDQSGRAIGFPTVNLSPTILPKGFKQGVYACLVKYDEKKSLGTLFYGPRLVKSESHNVLEIFIHDFDQEIYDREVEFSIASFIREARDFVNLEELKKEIERDVKTTQKRLKRLALDK